MSWTEERVKTLKILCAEGLSRGEIAKKLGGTTRSAVVAKIIRLRLTGAANPRQACRKPRARGALFQNKRVFPKPPTLRQFIRTAQRHAKSVREQPITVIPDLSAKVVNVVELADYSCRWPIGDPKTEGFGFCGRFRSGVSPYCTCHSAIAFTSPLSKRRRA